MKRLPVPDGLETTATARVVGVVQQQRPARYAPLEQGAINRVVLEVEEQDIPIIARRELSDKLAGMEQGWVLEVEGRLTQYRWSTCDGRQRLETVIEAERIQRVPDACPEQ